MATLTLPESLCDLITPNYADDPASLRAELRAATKALIEGAIDSGLPPADLPVDREAGVQMNITFPGSRSRAIRQLARADGSTEGVAALRFLYAAIARGDIANMAKPKGASLTAPYLALVGKQPRHHQSLFTQHVHTCLLSEQPCVSMIEASTGVGKTLGMIMAASDVLARHGGRCVITAPTLQLVKQFCAEHEKLLIARQSSMSGPQIPVARAIIGRNEFIDVEALLDILENDDIMNPDYGDQPIDPTPIKQWLERGAPPMSSESMLGSCYLTSTLQHISPMFPVDIVRLSSDSPADDPGHLAYKAQFGRDENGDHAPVPGSPGEIIYCSHAMLAVDTRRRRMVASGTDEGQAHNERAKHKLELANQTVARTREERQALAREKRRAWEERNEALVMIAAERDAGILPNWNYLLVDEAHLFEQNISNALSDNISLVRYIGFVKRLAAEGFITKKSATQAEKAFDLLRSLTHVNEVDLSYEGPLAEQLRAAIFKMISVPVKKKSLPVALRHIKDRLCQQQDIMQLAMDSLSNSYGLRAILDFSPVRQHPRLVVGRRSVSTELEFIWKSARNAACVSATLYMRRLDADSAAFSARVLNIPPQLVRECPVIRPAWMHEPVQAVWTPKGFAHGWLRPPSRRDKLTGEAREVAEEIWMDDVADILVDIYDSAQGGTLVLLTSYIAAKGLAERLNNMRPDLSNRLIVGNADTPLSHQKDAFVKQGLSKNKCLWLAVGQAGTGLDINGEHYGINDPTHDNLLTDLVIPKIPFGMNKSMTHKTRMEVSSHITWELFDTVMRFRQWMGRLVRREGLIKNRRIYILDNRLNDPTFKNYLANIRRAFSVYPQESFNPKPLSRPLLPVEELPQTRARA